METQKIILNEQRNVTLVTMVQKVGGEFKEITERPAVLILPGGGYAMCSDREAEPVAYGFLNAGYQVFILRYSLQENAIWPNPLDDYEQAMELIKKNADIWHVCTKRIAVVGFSAGGHLALCAATMAKNRPNAAIVGYPAVTKDICDMCKPNLPYPHEEVDELTCPCFLFAARDDNVVPINNLITMQKALSDNGVMFESHIYSYGGHGFSTAQDWLLEGKRTPRLMSWQKESIEWLNEVWGSFTANGFTEAKFGRLVNGNKEPYFSVRCTLNYLFENSAKIDCIAMELSLVKQLLSGFSKTTQESLGSLFRLEDVLPLLGIKEGRIEEIDEKLKGIKNE